ncbi:hypothetical protein MMC14_010718 [Varicellaria rhodocarpa]|nr:hypothetical protein [Varicellaria rhodocarpa]
MASVALPVPGSTIRLLSKSEIVDRLATTAKPVKKYNFYPLEGVHPKDLRRLRDTWTPDVHPLTLEIARLLVGRRIWVVRGQTWHQRHEKADKIKEVVRMKICRVQKENTLGKDMAYAEALEGGWGETYESAIYEQVNTQLLSVWTLCLHLTTTDMQNRYNRDRDEAIIFDEDMMMEYPLHQLRYGLGSGGGCDPVFFFGVLTENQ